MIFDISKKEGVWFDFPGGGRIQLRPLSVDDYMKISKECTMNKPFLIEEKGKPPRVLNHEVPDQDKQNSMINDATILAWEGFYDVNKKEIPCTFENKTILMRLSNPVLRDFVNEKVKILGEAADEAREVEEKNS